MPVTPSSRRALLRRGALALTTLGLVPATLAGAEPTRPANGGMSVDPRRYGAAGDGRTDDTAPLRRAIRDAEKSHGEVVVPPGRYRVNEPLTVSSPITLRGSGDGSVLIAGHRIPEILQVTIPQRGLFSDLKFDGNDLADRCVTQTVREEGSVGTRWVRCKFTGAREVQVLNHGCEDVTYLDCATDGDENKTATVRDALSVQVPQGAVRIIGGEWFGRCSFDYQQVTILGSTIGPLYVDNPEGRSDSILFVQGSYLYDGGVHGGACVDTDTSLSNIHLAGCYLVAQAQDSFLNGHLPSVTVRALDCIFLQPPSAPPGAEFHVLTASGDGQLVIDGGRAALQPSAALHGLRAVGASGIQTSMPVPCLGLT